MIIYLPWLDPTLSSNARVHWSQTAKAVARARRDACVNTLSITNSAKRAVAASLDKIDIKVTFYPPDNRRRDKQNMPANKTIKSYLDGIADALGIDDNKFNPSFAYGDVVKGGEIIVEVLQNV